MMMMVVAGVTTTVNSLSLKTNRDRLHVLLPLSTIKIGFSRLLYWFTILIAGSYVLDEKTLQVMINMNGIFFIFNGAWIILADIGFITTRKRKIATAGEKITFTN